MRQYIALIHKDAGSDYGVSFPDLPGVISAGKTLDEARDMGAEALALHLEGLAADGEAAPEPSSLEEIMKDAQNKDGVAVLIAAPASDVKSVRINVTMPADVLDQIDMRDADGRAGDYQMQEKSDAGYSEKATALDRAHTIASDTIFLQI